MIHRQAALLVDRFHWNSYYGWIDTKYDPVTVEDFPEDAVHSGDTIYSWIQGRGLEAVSGHCKWFEKSPLQADKLLAGRLKAIAAALNERLSAAKNRDNGRMFFFMSPQGEIFKGF